VAETIAGKLSLLLPQAHLSLLPKASIAENLQHSMVKPNNQRLVNATNIAKVSTKVVPATRATGGKPGAVATADAARPLTLPV
jgi:hypothetical protein